MELLLHCFITGTFVTDRPRCAHFLTNRRPAFQFHFISIQLYFWCPNSCLLPERIRVPVSLHLPSSLELTLSATNRSARSPPAFHHLTNVPSFFTNPFFSHWYGQIGSSILVLNWLFQADVFIWSFASRQSVFPPPTGTFQKHGVIVPVAWPSFSVRNLPK